MEDLFFLAIIIALAPPIAAQAHPISFGLMLVTMAFSWSIYMRRSQTTNWILGFFLFLVVIWTGSVLIIFVLKLPGFAPH
jgi:hypothetical protein